MQEDLHGIVLKSFDLFIQLLIGFCQEKFGEKGNIFLPVTEGGQLDGKFIETVEQILAEPALAIGFLEILVGGDDNTDIDVHFLGTAYRA